jgi:hypothetical protein
MALSHEECSSEPDANDKTYAGAAGIETLWENGDLMTGLQSLVVSRWKVVGRPLLRSSKWETQGFEVTYKYSPRFIPMG